MYKRCLSSITYNHKNMETSHLALGEKLRKLWYSHVVLDINWIDSITGKSQIGLHVGPVSLTFAFSCFCSLKGYCLYIMACLGEPCPSS